MLSFCFFAVQNGLPTAILSGVKERRFVVGYFINISYILPKICYILMENSR